MAVMGTHVEETQFIEQRDIVDRNMHQQHKLICLCVFQCVCVS